MVEILWHRRETRRQTEKTNFDLEHGRNPSTRPLTPALTLPQVRYGLSLLLLEVYCTPGVDYICRQVQRQLQRNESARFYHYRARKHIPPRKLRRDIQ